MISDGNEQKKKNTTTHYLMKFNAAVKMNYSCALLNP